MERKTVGIITFHQALNYGAVLQAYALKEVCEEMGYETHIVDYDYASIEERVVPFAKFKIEKDKKTALLKLIRDLLGYYWDKKREREFLAFRKKYFNESSPCFSIKDINELNYDFLIAGSDQIWNRGITKHRYDPVFFMDFISVSKKIIYAASSEDVPFNGEKEEAFYNALKKMQGYVAIREERLANYVAELTGKVYPIVIDPVLLAGRELLSKVKKRRTPESPYILLYQIASNPTSDISIKSLEHQFGCNVYSMSVPRIGSIYARKGDVGPEEFLSILRGAEFIVTNSFHGIALSLLFEKQFYVYENGGVMSRIDGLLEQLNLQNRKVKMVADILQEKRIDYEKVNDVLEELRQKSKDFLVKSFRTE